MPRSPRRLHANLHQGCNIFQPANGRQCTAVALIALLIIARLRTFHGTNELFDAMTYLNPSDLDNILFEGTSLYSHISANTGIEGFRGHEHLPPSVVGFPYDISYLLDIFTGHTNPNVVFDSAFGMTSLSDAFQHSFVVSHYLLATFGETSVAVYGDLENEIFHVFDSHERNFDNEVLGGTAVLLSFHSLADLTTFFQQNFNSQFQLTPVLLSVSAQNIGLEQSCSSDLHMSHASTNASQKSYTHLPAECLNPSKRPDLNANMVHISKEKESDCQHIRSKMSPSQLTKHNNQLGTGKTITAGKEHNRVKTTTKRRTRSVQKHLPCASNVSSDHSYFSSQVRHKICIKKSKVTDYVLEDQNITVLSEEPCVIVDSEQVADFCEISTSPLHNHKLHSDHSYFSSQVRRKTCTKKLKVTNYVLEDQDITVLSEEPCVIVDSDQISDFCEIATSEHEQEMLTDFVTCPLHNNQYRVFVSA